MIHLKNNETYEIGSTEFADTTFTVCIILKESNENIANQIWLYTSEMRNSCSLLFKIYRCGVLSEKTQETVQVV